jgi:hypothetical protein
MRLVRRLGEALHNPLCCFHRIGWPAPVWIIVGLRCLHGGNCSMADLWDIPPFPDRGDSSPQETRDAKSAALDEWERVENRLGELNARFGRSLSGAATYGNGTTLTARLTILERTADAYFVTHQNQAVEGQFCALVQTVNKMADRRNDIAHGVTTPYTTTVDENGFPDLTTTTYVLAPAQYDVKRMDESNKASFIYSSHELALIGRRFLELSVIIYQFMERFVP